MYGQLRHLYDQLHYRYGQLRYRYRQLRYRYSQLRYRYDQIRFIWQERAPRTVYCVLPPALVYFAVLQPGLFSVYCLIHCTSTRTTFSELSQGTMLVCHCLQCNQSCHQFVAKQTLMSFITGLGYFISWGNCSDQTCFPLLDADISKLLTTAPAHVDKHVTRKKGDYVCNLC